MDRPTATRSELLARRAQTALAEQGRDILKEKREQLMGEFRKIADVVIAGAGSLDETATQSRRALALAEATDGPEAVRSAALATRSTIPITARAVSVMGVRIADIQYDPIGRPRTGRGYTLAGTCPCIDLVAERFEAELDQLLELATYELRLRRIVEEIAKTTRRVSALESVVIPRLEREQALIQTTLDERERQDRFRLKRFADRRGDRLEDGE